MFTVLDGGMGGELLARELIPRGELWSAQALLDAPEKVALVHQAYIDAGARLITTNSYSTVPSYLDKLGIASRYAELTQLAGKIARQVADTSDFDVEVAGGIPPLDESYRPELAPADAIARPIYEALATALDPWVDLFLCETMSCVRESVNAVASTRRVNSEKRIYVSWSLAETPGAGLRSKETIEEALRAVEPYNIAGFLFNCTSPEAISAGLKQMRELTDAAVLLGAYPNRLSIPEGWTLDNEISAKRRADLDIQSFLTFADEWQTLGARIIGGCCGIGPDYIGALQSVQR